MKLSLKNYKRELIFGGVILLVGILLGWLFFGGSGKTSSNEENIHEHSDEEGTIWTCSMHPQIQKDGPGQCPLCGMDLIPLSNSSSSQALPDEVPMSASAMKLAEIQTMVVTKEEPEKAINLLGRIKPDERLKFSQTAHIPGRIEQLYINFTGEKVHKGQKLASFYSPELVTAQKELFEVLKDEALNPELAKAARSKLKQWKFTDEQIAQLEQDQQVRTEFDILSDHSGYVMELNITEGDHVKQGQQLFNIVDLSKVWVLFEAYENDLPWIKINDDIEIEVRSVPGNMFHGKVSFIDPFIDPNTRVAYVRVELPNPNTQLKPDMFANGSISSKLDMDEPVILIPRSAALWTGKRAVVYVKLPHREHNSFIYREVILGEDAGDFYVVKTGLEEGEEIAVNGVFKIDAAAQLAGKKSMMNPNGSKVSIRHDHRGGSGRGEMDNINSVVDRVEVPQAFKEQLGVVVATYLLLKDNLVNDNVDIREGIAAYKGALKKVEMSLVTGEAHKIWMTSLNLMNTDLDQMAAATSINEQRNYFSNVSNALNDAVSTFGVLMEEGEHLYLEFCPMANENTGGYWLSGEENIMNPYYGSKMLKCGSVIDTIH